MTIHPMIHAVSSRPEESRSIASATYSMGRERADSPILSTGRELFGNDVFLRFILAQRGQCRLPSSHAAKHRHVDMVLALTA
jgi:hypothetical protein